MPKSPHVPRKPNLYLYPVEHEIRVIARSTLLDLLLDDPKVEALFQRWDRRWGLLAEARKMRPAVDRFTAQFPAVHGWRLLHDDASDPGRASTLSKSQGKSTLTPEDRRRWASARKAATALRRREEEVRSPMVEDAVAWLQQTLSLPDPDPPLADELIHRYRVRVERAAGVDAPFRETTMADFPRFPAIQPKAVWGDPDDPWTRRRLIEEVDAALELERARQALRPAQRRPKDDGAHLKESVEWLYRVGARGELVADLARELHTTRKHRLPLTDCLASDHKTIRQGIETATRLLTRPT